MIGKITPSQLFASCLLPSGVVCCAISEGKAKALQLPPMCATNEDAQVIES